MTTSSLACSLPQVPAQVFCQAQARPGKQWIVNDDI